MAQRDRVNTPDAVTLYATNSSRLLATMTSMKPRTWDPKRIIFMQSLIRRYLARKRLLTMLASKTQKCRHIVKEIVDTEESYLTGLRTCITVFMEPLHREAKENPKTAVVPPEKIGTLFGNMPEVVALHAQLLHDLRSRLALWDAKSRIGDIFLRIVPNFSKVYVAYCNNYDRAYQFYSTICRDQRVQTWFDNRSQQPENGGAQLPTHLITPVQRLPRYILLLQDLRKNMMRSHPDYYDITKALQEVQAVINLVETTMDGIQQVSRITRMQSRMQGMTESILATNRKLKFDAPLLWVCDDGLRPSHFYLFTDWLLWGTLKEKTKRRDTAVAEKPSDKPPSDDEPLLYRGKIPIQLPILLGSYFGNQNDTVVKEIPDMESVKNAFLVISGGTTVSVATETVKEKNEWLMQLRNAIQNLGGGGPNSARNLQWTFEVSIKGFIARKPPGGGKEYTAYIIEKKETDGSVTQVERRYSEFTDLHQRLTKALPTFKVPLPKKTKLFGDLSYEELQTRRVMLEKYLHEILASNEVTRSSEAVTVSNFLSPAEAETAFSAKTDSGRPVSGHLMPQHPNDKKQAERPNSGLFKSGSLPREISGGFRSATPTGSGSPAVSTRRPQSVQVDDPAPRGISKSPLRISMTIDGETTNGEERPVLGTQRSALGASNPELNYNSIGRTKASSAKNLSLLPTPAPSPTAALSTSPPAAPTPSLGASADRRGFLSSQRSTPNLLSHSTPVLPSLPAGFAAAAAAAEQAKEDQVPSSPKDRSNTFFGGDRSPRSGPRISPRTGTFSAGSGNAAPTIGARVPSPRPTVTQTTFQAAAPSESATAAPAPAQAKGEQRGFIGRSRREPAPTTNNP